MKPHPGLRFGPWGKVSAGDTVTSFGRHGAGQPVVTGELARIEAHGTGLVQPNDGSDARRRSLANLRRVLDANEARQERASMKLELAAKNAPITNPPIAEIKLIAWWVQTNAFMNSPARREALARVEQWLDHETSPQGMALKPLGDMNLPARTWPG